MRDQKINLLVLEDDKTLAELLKLSLLDIDVRVRIAENCKSAEEILKDFKPDLALIDIGLPDGNGFDFAKSHFEANGSHNPTAIIFLTGRPDADCRINTFSINTIDYITKPFSITELTLKLSNWKKYITMPQPERFEFNDNKFSRRYFYQKLTDICSSKCADPNFGIGDAAEELNMSVRTLQRKLKIEYNNTFSELVGGIRISKAQHLLNLQMEPKRIFALCGYRHQESFFAAFKRATHMTPKEFQRSQQEEVST